MPYVGVLGGMGSAATADFLTKLVALTPAQCDQEHLPVIAAFLPQIPDRSSAILGTGSDPLPRLLAGIDLLNQVGAGVIAIPCNTTHHWYRELAQASRAPILHIADAALARVPQDRPVMLLATRGTLVSGFYQRALALRATECVLPSPEQQQLVDKCIALVKAGEARSAAKLMAGLLENVRKRGVRALLLACTELPFAATGLACDDLLMIDCSLELARVTVDYALRLGWNRS
jgi:aspartate racemase